jgi:hypothetical protein
LVEFLLDYLSKNFVGVSHGLAKELAEEFAEEFAKLEKMLRIACLIKNHEMKCGYIPPVKQIENGMEKFVDDVEEFITASC